LSAGAGLDQDGFIAREGDLASVPPPFAPVVRAAKTAILAAFGPDRLHSAYLYGSIPRGTAVPGVSDLDVLLPRWRDRLGQARTDGSLRVLGSGVGRRLVRTGFTLVMPRWGGWTSDLHESAAVFGRYYPARRDQMAAAAAAAARTAAADRAVLGMLINDLGPWLTREYTAVHGRKAPRGVRSSRGQVPT
jgi:hypothetical protein